MSKIEIPNEQTLNNVLQKKIKLCKEESTCLTGYPQIDKPWLKYYKPSSVDLEVPQKTLYEILKTTAQNRKDNPAIDYNNMKKMSYKQLIQQIDVTASAFLKNGVKSGDIVTFLTANTPENIIAFYAINKIGAIANMLDLELKEQALIDRINASNSKVVIALDQYADNINNILEKTNIEKIIVTSPFEYLPIGLKQVLKLKTKNPKYIKNNSQYIKWKEFQKQGKTNPNNFQEKYKPNTPACIVYTSGTTGNPKGTVLTNENISAMPIQYKNSGLEFDENDRLFNEEPPFLAFCMVLGINLPLTLGMCTVIFPEYKPEIFADRVYESKTNHILAGPVDWDLFQKNKNTKNRDYSFIKTASSGSVAFNQEKKEEITKFLNSLGYKGKMYEGYGMTEGSSAMCTNIPQYDSINTVGIPLPLTNICIFNNDTQEEQKYNEIGEICFLGPTIMKEYYQSPDKTNEALKKHKDGKTWLHTGDLGLVLEDGGVKVVGRKKRMIIRHDGYDISPFEIENVINQLKEVDDCCVVATPDYEHGYGEMPSAYVVLKENVDQNIALENIKKVCNLKIINRNLPKKYVLIKEMPLTKIKKVDFRTLEELEKTSNQNENDEKWVYRKEMKRGI